MMGVYVKKDWGGNVIKGNKVNSNSSETAVFRNIRENSRKPFPYSHKLNSSIEQKHGKTTKFPLRFSVLPALKHSRLEVDI